MVPLWSANSITLIDWQSNNATEIKRILEFVIAESENYAGIIICD